jgi:hypothetical protein
VRVACNVAAAACGSCHLNFQGARTMRANQYWRRGRGTRSGGTQNGIFARNRGTQNGIFAGVQRVAFVTSTSRVRVQ